MAEAVRHDKTARQLRLLSDALDSGRLGPMLGEQRLELIRDLR